MARPPKQIRRKPAIWLTQKRADKKAGFKQHESALSRQSRVLESHEKRVADHTALQSKTAILSLVVSVATTLVLIWVAYMQYRTADRQVRLEYAKVEPSFSLNVESRESAYLFNDVVIFDLPTRVRVIASRGDAVVTKVELTQDAGAYRKNGQSSGTRCALAIDRLFTSNSSGMEAALNPLLLRRVSGPYLRGPKPNYTTIHPEALWVTLTYNDIFGQERRTLLRYQNGQTSVVPSGRIDRIWENTYEVRFNSGADLGPRKLFIGTEASIPAECRYFVKVPGA